MRKNNVFSIPLFFQFQKLNILIFDLANNMNRTEFQYSAGAAKSVFVWDTSSWRETEPLTSFSSSHIAKLLSHAENKALWCSCSIDAAPLYKVRQSSITKVAEWVNLVHLLQDLSFLNNNPWRTDV